MQEEKLGSPTWRENVFSQDPARDVRGRSRPTQRYTVQEPDGRITVAEGGYAAVVRALLTSMVRAGVVARFKLEPFALSVGEHGVEATPDVAFELANQQVYVAELKSARFLTEEKLSKLREVEAVLSRARLPYLLWTSEWPLSSSCCRLVREIRRCGTSDVDEMQIERLQSVLVRGPQSIEELRRQDLFRREILAAVWRGFVHINVFKELTDATVVSLDARERAFESALKAPVAAQSWWQTLGATN